MREHDSPYVRQCTFCGNGLLRLYRCQRCDSVVAICDECELVWQDIEAASRNAKQPSDAAFPACPACGTKRSKWSRLDVSEIRDAGLDGHLAGGRE